MENPFFISDMVFITLFVIGVVGALLSLGISHHKKRRATR